MNLKQNQVSHQKKAPCGRSQSLPIVALASHSSIQTPRIASVPLMVFCQFFWLVNVAWVGLLVWFAWFCFSLFCLFCVHCWWDSFRDIFVCFAKALAVNMFLLAFMLHAIATKLT